jgi:hypothetical protein
MITEGPRPIGAALNRNLGSPTAPGEEAVWRESERHHEAARRAENGAAWYEYHLAAADRLRATLSALVAHHEREAQKYKYLPKGAA